MAQLALRPPAAPTLRTDDPDVHLGLHRIICVGRNYADHAREMGHDPDAEPPFFFMKPAAALVHSGATIPYPPATNLLHFEAELAVLIGTGGAEVSPEDADGLIWGYAAANDLTRRDLQAEAKEKRRPWDMAKGFDRSCVVGQVTRAAEVDVSDLPIRCFVDHEVRQAASTADMIWSVPQIIAHLSRLLTLQPGDLILTGTPAGVGALQAGQTCKVTVGDLDPAIVTIG